jgi:hypothetical protein
MAQANVSIAEQGLQMIADVKTELEYAVFEYKTDQTWIQYYVAFDSKNNSLYTITTSKSEIGEFDQGELDPRFYTLSQLSTFIKAYSKEIQYFQMECVGTSQKQFGVVKLGHHK